MSSTGETARRFLAFAKECDGISPLYSRLSREISYDGELLALADEATSTPVTNLLFGAVHSLLLRGVDHDLASFYPSVTDDPEDGDPFPAFRNFCSTHREDIVETLKTRRVQTNEVRRSALLFPVFWEIYEKYGKPLSLVEVGASAGLNLLFDRYAYDYGDAGRSGGSGLVLRCEVRGKPVHIPDSMPEVASRVGLELSPVDVRSEEDTRWLFALIWPEDFEERSGFLHKAIRIAREDPPRLIPGDATVTLPEALKSVSPDTHPVVFFTFTLNQLPEKAREDISSTLSSFAEERGSLSEVFVGWRPGEPYSRIELTDRPGRTQHLAYCDGHGAWLEWLG